MVDRCAGASLSLIRNGAQLVSVPTPWYACTMQIVYRGRGIEDARTARDVLAGCGIAAHIADPPPEGSLGASPTPDIVSVLVDNRLLDRARRALQPWISAKTRDDSHEDA